MTARITALALALGTFATLATLAPPAAAQVHRWVDEHGRVHYGDRPMGGTGSTLRIRAESATAPGASPQAAQPAAQSLAHRVMPAGAAAGAVGQGGLGRPGPAGAAGSADPAQPVRAARASTIDGLLAAQQRQPAPTPMPRAHTPGMQALVAQCQANRGVDCDTPQGLRNLQREHTPITREEQARIAGLRARRATCARAPGAQGC